MGIREGLATRRALWGNQRARSCRCFAFALWAIVAPKGQNQRGNVAPFGSLLCPFVLPQRGNATDDNYVVPGGELLKPYGR